MSGSFSGYVGFFVFLLIGMMFKFLVNNSNSKYKKGKEQFLEAERQANFARVREIPAQAYYTPDKTSLPIKNYGNGDADSKVKAAQEKALKKAESKMLRLDPPMKNIEIKQTYGATNLESITHYEENYEQFIRALSLWAEELIKLENFGDAKTLLSICVDMNSLIFLPYSLICDIYEKENDRQSLIALQQKINDTPIIKSNDILAKKINDYITGKLSPV